MYGYPPNPNSIYQQSEAGNNKQPLAIKGTLQMKGRCLATYHDDLGLGDLEKLMGVPGEWANLKPI